MRAPLLVGIIASLHVVGIGSLIFIQGCGTTRPTSPNVQVEPPPPPMMPPRPVTTTPRATRTANPVVSKPTPPAAVGATHVLRKGETLSHLAKRYGISVGDLTEYNNLTNANRVREGQKLNIPAYAPKLTDAPAPIAAAPPPRAAPAAPSGGPTYVVQSGDTLSKIASLYGTKVSTIKAVNGLTSDRILVGQKLIVSGAGSTPPKAVSSTSVAGSNVPRTQRPTPSVRDDLDLDVGVLDLDGLDLDETDVQIDAIAVPPAIDEPTAASIPPVGGFSGSITLLQDKPIIYTVVNNDTVDEIAKLFIVSKSEILELNNLGPDDTLSPGQQIKIPPSAL
jgi:LysM repeat protein